MPDPLDASFYADLFRAPEPDDESDDEDDETPLAPADSPEGDAHDAGRPSGRVAVRVPRDAARPATNPAPATISPHVLDLGAAVELLAGGSAGMPGGITPPCLVEKTDGASIVPASETVSPTQDTSSGPTWHHRTCLARPGSAHTACLARTERDTPLPSHALLRAALPTGLRARDGEILRTVARLRLLSFAQVADLFFPGHSSAARRRMRKLESLGWVSLFEERLTFGGHPKYVLPTSKALRWAFDALERESGGTPHESLVRTMLADQPRTALELAPFTAPAFLPHQRETNAAVIAFKKCYPLGVTWASAFERPFPTRRSGHFLPQPDFVLVMAPFGEAPRLVFGEHDRGSEPVARFMERKVDTAASLLFGDTLGRLTGFDRFEVWVTVNDVAGNAPLRRIAVLQDAARAHYAERLFRFTLLDWALAGPEKAIWYRDQRPDVAIERLDADLHAATGRTVRALDGRAPGV